MKKEKIYYQLTCEEDDYSVVGAFFKNASNEKDIDKKDFTEFPPKQFSQVIVFNDIFNYCKTTEVQSVEKINDNEYRLYTLDSTYLIKRLSVLA